MCSKTVAVVQRAARPIAHRMPAPRLLRVSPQRPCLPAGSLSKTVQLCLHLQDSPFSEDQLQGPGTHGPLHQGHRSQQDQLPRPLGTCEGLPRHHPCLGSQSTPRLPVPCLPGAGSLVQPRGWEWWATLPAQRWIHEDRPRVPGVATQHGLPQSGTDSDPWPPEAGKPLIPNAHQLIGETERVMVLVSGKE